MDNRTHTELPTEGDPTDGRAISDPGTDHSFGNTHDDDGRAIDSYFEAAPDSPVPNIPVDYGVPAIPRNTRFLSRLITVAPDGQAVLAFPADPNRSKLIIRVLTADAFAYVASENIPSLSSTGGDPSAGIGFFGAIDYVAGTYDFSGHTGPVYIANAFNAAISVSVIVVTV